jgi:dTMP kinase
MTLGRYIVIEGPDLVGKTTIARMVQDWLAGEGIDGVYAPQPGSTNLGEQLRHIIKHEQRIAIGKETEALVFVLDQMAFVENIALGALDGGKWVISDRNNYISGLIYQVLNGVEATRLDEFYSIVQTPKVDVVFILHADPSALAERAKKRDDKRWDRYESNPEFMDRVHSAYKKLLDNHGNRLANMSSSCIEIDANMAVEEVFSEIKTYLTKLL